MPTVEEVESKIDILIKQLNITQAEAMSKRLAAAFVAGSDSITSTIYSGDPELSEQQERAIKQLSAEHFGYISEFNRQIGEQLKTDAQDILRNSGGYKDIANYTKQIFEGQENVVIDHVGQTRKIIEVGKDGKLREVEKVITRKYVTTVDNYADMLGRTATHSAWAEGRVIGHQKLGFNFWRYVSVCDERSRADHCAVSGSVFKYGTPESDMALDMMHSPHCRCRAVVYFTDESLNTPMSFFEEQKKKAGLKYDDEKQKWVFRLKR